jgi:hypothetical protein
MRRALRFGSPIAATLFALALAAGCGSGGDSTSSGGGEGGSGTATGSGTGGSGTGGSGGSVTTTTTKTGSTSTSTHAGGAGGAAGGSGQGGAACSQGTIECDGSTKKVCDGKGGYSDVINCALQGNLTCIPGYGCAVCAPGTGSCNGDVGQYCKDDGSAFLTEICDPTQGMQCNPGTGRCTGACSPKALGTSYIGCEYMPTVTPNLTDSGTFHFAAAVSNTTNVDATITVTRGPNAVATETVPANSVKVLQLPWIDQLKGPSSMFATPFPSSMIVPQGAYRLRSTQPVTVYQFNPLEYQVNGSPSYTNDASLLLPTNAWTGNYRVAGWHHWYATSGFFAVTASQDGTTVNLKAGPQAQIKGGIGGLDGAGNGTVSLNAGDVMVVATQGCGDGDPSCASDITGAAVAADKPVQVIGGHQCTDVPDGVPACDHIEESLFPYETLSTTYLVTPPLIPTQPAPKVELVRIVATTDNTTLTFDPPQPNAPASIAQAGQWVQLSDNAQSFSVTASQPILVAQYMEGQEAGGGSGDPAMALAVAKEQFRDSYLFHAPTNYDYSYCNIMAPTGVDVQVDGASVGPFTPIGGTGYSVAFVTLSNAGDGNHNAKSSKPFGLTVYGYGQYTSYWYAGGSNLQKLHE